MIITPIDWRSFKKHQDRRSPSLSNDSRNLQHEMETLLQSYAPESFNLFSFNQNINKNHIDRMNLDDLSRLADLVRLIDSDKINMIFHQFLIKGYFPYLKTQIILKNLNYHDHIHLKKSLKKYDAQYSNLNGRNIIEVNFSQNQTPINTRYLDQNWI
ncbi:hypothetical protein N9N67_08920 [Bacteriovoracaceae bacterium]|nr:hypothetical protein [Bacteriovoracaceae bacterium]